MNYGAVESNPREEEELTSLTFFSGISIWSKSKLLIGELSHPLASILPY
jgi:hypothetical protein